MARPESVLVGPVRFDIEYRALEEGLFGETHYKAARIEIADDLSDSMIRSTLWHEILHALILVHAPHRADAIATRIIPVIDEMYVGVLENAVLTFVRDNPEEWDWINGWTEL